MANPDWLIWAREIQAIAQTGLHYVKDPFDRERYEQLQTLAAQIMATESRADSTVLENLFRQQSGYATPKLEVRVAAFDEQNRLLMVREVLDEDRWTLPGGWADVNLTPAENAAKEVLEETGYIVRITKLAMAFDRDHQGHTPPEPFSITKLFFTADVIGGEARTSVETSAVSFFERSAIPSDLSTGRILPHEIDLLFAHRADPNRPAEFD
ncbi:MAG: NUDIX hydrolase N-terminal domain-containing protein [Acetobacter papayae]